MSFGFGNGLNLRRSAAAAPVIGGVLDISLLSYANKTFDATLATGVAPNAVRIIDDSTFVVAQSNTIYKFSMATAGDLTTAAFDSSGIFSGTTVGNFARGVHFANDGNSLYWFSETNDQVRKYLCAAPYQVSGLTFSNNGTAFNTGARDLWVKNDETVIMISDRDGNTIDRRDMGTPGLANTIAFVADTPVVSPDGYFFTEDGLTAVGLDNTTKDIVQRELTVAFDLSTMTETARFSLIAQVGIGDISGIHVDPGFTFCLVTDFTTGLIHQYNF